MFLPRTSGTCLVAGLMLGVLVAACGQKTNEADNSMVAMTGPETAEEKAKAIERAFAPGGGGGGVDEATTKQVQALFDRLTKAGAERDTSSGLAQFDFEYMLAAAEAFGMAVPNGPSQRETYVSSLKDGARKGWFVDGGNFEWHISRVMRIERQADERFLLAYARHDFDELGTNIKARWWLVKGAIDWKIFDWEFLNTGIRISRLLGGIVNSSTVPGWAYKIGYLNSAQMHVQQGDTKSAMRDLDRAVDAGMPADLEAVRWNLIATCSYVDQDYATALKQFDHVLELKADFPDARYMRGSCLFNLKRYAEAIPDLEWYVKTLGSDAAAMLELANCLTWLDRGAEALEYYRGSMRDIPQLETLQMLGTYLPEGKEAEVRDWFLMLPEKEAAFATLASYFYLDEFRPAVVRELCAAFRTVNPESDSLAYHEARLLLDDDKPAEAATKLRPTLKSVSGDALIDHQRLYWEAMYRSGQSLTALEEARDAFERRQAFLYLAESCFMDSDADLLNQLCEAWQKAGAKGTTLHYYLAEADAIRQDWPAAEKHYREGLDKIRADDEFRARLRQGLWFAMHKQARTLEAYGEFKPPAEVFENLARLLFVEGNPELLFKLCEAHAAVDKDDPWLARANGDLAWLKQEYAAAHVAYAKYFGAPQREHYDYGEVVERAVRAALRAGNGDAAVDVAATAYYGGDDWYSAIALAGAGRPKEAMAAIDRLVTDIDAPVAVQWMAELYNDPDVSAKLRGAEYAELHKRFPPPAKTGE